MRKPTSLPPSIGTVKLSGGDRDYLGIAIRQRIHDQGPQLVMVDANGAVYVRRHSDPRAETIEKYYPSMVVGRFDHRATRQDLIEAILFTYRAHLIRRGITEQVAA